MFTKEKFNYLRTLLKDSALSAIPGLTFSAENYGQALEILQARYGNDQVLISVRNVKSLRVETSSYDSLLVPLLNKKLPNKTKATEFY